jgi:hypothetical protein
MKTNTARQLPKLFASLILLVLASILVSGCGGQSAVEPTAAPANPQAADSAAKQAVASDAANAQARAAAEARGKQAVSQQGGQAKP